MIQVLRFALVLWPTLLFAQSSPTATFYRVEDGVFELREGSKAIDLTDQHLLLALRRNRTCLAVVLNGREDCPKVGTRYDFKYPHGPFQLKYIFAEKKSCFLDVVDVQEAKGAPGVVTFRLYCP
jgi:hypothetical protein